MSTGTVKFKVKITDDGSFKKLEVDADDFNDAVKRIKGETDKLSSSLSNLSKFAIGLNQIMELAERVGKALRKVVDVGTANELQKLNLTTLFKGNAKAAEDMFARISKYGKETVYDKEGLIEAQKTMMSFGISSEQAFTTLKQIGDIAMGDGQKMQSLALAFSQATSTGKLMGQDLIQMINAGFNPLAVISEHTGESMASLKEKMSQGAISAEMLAQAFQWATEEGSLFYKGAESAGSTTEGKINQLKDTFNEFLISVFNLLQPVINTVLDFSTNVLNAIPTALETVRMAFGNVIDTISDFKGIIIGVAVAVGTLTIAINANKIAMAAQELVLNLLIIKEKIQIALTKAWKVAQATLNAVMNANPIALIISAIALLVGAIMTVAKKTTGWAETWESVHNYINKSLGQMGAWFKLKWLQIADYVLTGIEAIEIAWYKVQSLWNESAADRGLSRIKSNAEERAREIAEQKEILAGKRQERLDATVTWAVKWKGKDKEDEDNRITPVDIDEEPSVKDKPTPKGNKEERYKKAIEAAKKAQLEKENALKKLYQTDGDKDAYESGMELVAIEGLEEQQKIAEKYNKDTAKIEQDVADARIRHRENEFSRQLTQLEGCLADEKLALTTSLNDKEITQEQYDKALRESEERNLGEQLELYRQFGKDATDIMQKLFDKRKQIAEGNYDDEAAALQKNLDDTEISLKTSLANKQITQDQHDRLMLVAKVKFYDDMLKLTRAYGKKDTQALKDVLDAQLNLQNFDQGQKKKPFDTFTKGWGGLKGIGSSIRDIKSALTETDNAWDALTQTVDGFISLFQSMQQIVEIINTITQATQTMQAVRNVATQQELGNARNEVLANTAKAGSGAASSMASIPYFGPVLAIAAMGAVLAALASLPKFANGGLVYGPTLGLIGEYGGASSNPEVIAPLNKLRGLLGEGGGGKSEVKFRIEGRELVGILNKQNNIYKRSK